jgi:hypothetical protein
MSKNIKQVVRVIEGKSYTTYEKKDPSLPYPNGGRGKMKSSVGVTKTPSTGGGNDVPS